MTQPKLPDDSQPIWFDEASIPTFQPLTEDQTVDVAIVGGGITGITAAYLLTQQGLNVALLEASTILNGTTGHTTAKITAQHGLIYDELINKQGYNPARMYYEAQTDALQLIEELVQNHQIDCHFEKQDAYLYSTSGEYKNKLEKEYQAYDHLNIKGNLENQIPFNVTIENALSMKNQAQFHPLKYLTHLVNLITQQGGKIYEQTTAVDVEDAHGSAVVVTREGFRIKANYVLACSHFPFYEGTGMYFTRMYASRAYALAVKAEKPYPGDYFLSVDQPDRSIRKSYLNGEEIYLIIGEGHKTGQGEGMMKHYKNLKRFCDKVFDENSYEILHRWSTQDLTTIDKIPYVGAISKKRQNVLIATGFRKWGMTNGTNAAQLMSDIVLGNLNPYEQLFSPSRFSADPSLKKFFVENLDVAKHLIKGKMEMPKTQIDDMNNDEGAVIRVNGERKGAYKDKEGNVYVVDTTCTHVGCELNWNESERTWDCPCHGSRFSYTGEVIEGPAETPLPQHDYKMLENFNFNKKESGY
ncbi:(2Fe-2S)-binding protein [Tenuibacillus multivorans]|uniref:Glycine/D-amino acid oxidase n=2 Tax=Tenuibacillus multivorans TaxID=237069 RepID=A0A1H0G394_9BACI|nr:FAD-dependent oxidoreductase [Tenuibacillus multivorans]GEL78103.1 (2Fe-2S)-binding protein [Tenuibacillus multivorans]SDO01199.1 Glycine/D-amino acid oxidase [Tenuibacillus multivorans]